MTGRPTLTDSQRGLRRAHHVRLRRFRFHDELRQLPHAEAKATLAAAITEMPDWLQGADVQTVLQWVPRIGVQASGHYLQMIDVRQVRRLRELSERQRLMLAALLLHGTDRP